MRRGGGWWPGDQEALRTHHRRALIVKVDDSGEQQLVDLEGLASDKPTKVVRILPHGFSSNPPADAEGIMKSLGGRSDRGMFIGGEHPKYRQKNLPTGNAVLYDDKGNVVWSKSDGGVTTATKKGPIVLDPSDAGDKVYLGGDPAKGHKFALVMTTAGPSINVYARIG